MAAPNGSNRNKIASSNTHDTAAIATSVIELFDIPDSDVPTHKQRFPLNKEDEEYISKAMAKWGDDYIKMFRDIKGVNCLQHSEAKLRKLGSRYLLLSPSQRRCPIPENVRELLPGGYAAEEEAFLRSNTD